MFSIPFLQTDMHLHVAENGKAASSAVVWAMGGGDTGHPRGATGCADGDCGADEPEEDGGDRG